jgi:hypothetical protein
MEQPTHVRTTKRTAFIPPYSTTQVLIQPTPAQGPDGYGSMQFVPRHHISALHICAQLLAPNASSLQVSNITSRPIDIPGRTVLGTLKLPSLFRFYELPKELRDLILDYALLYTRPNSKILTLRSQPGFVKNLETGAITLKSKRSGQNSPTSVAFTFKSRCSLALTSKRLAEDYHSALLRLLLQEEEAWLKIEVINFDFRAARDFLHSCPQEQLSKLRSPGKLALNLSVHDWLSTQDRDWCANIHEWSATCAAEMVNPWVIFTRAGFKKRRWELFLKHALRTTYKQYRDDSAIIQQFGMILEALVDICELNQYSRAGGMNARTYKRMARELNSEEYYSKGIEYDNGVGPDPAAWQGFVEQK